MEISYPPPNQEQLLEANEELFCDPSAIPVRTRLRYLVEDDPDPAKHHIDDFLELDELASSLDLTEDEFSQVLDDLNIPEEFMPKDNFGNFVLMPGMNIVVKEELAWREFYDSIEQATIPQIAAYFDVSGKNIRNIIERTGLAPMYKKPGRWYYPKQVAYRVRAEMMMFPPARDNQSAGQLKDITGESLDWLEPRLNAEYYDVDLNPETPNLAEYGGDLMRGSSNRILTHYGRQLVALIVKDAKKHQYQEENSKTVGEVARILGRDYEWVRTRTFKAKDDIAYGRVGVDEERRLRLESDWQRNLEPFSADEMTCKQVAKSLGVWYTVVDEVCVNIGLTPNLRRTANNRVVDAYTPEDRLQIAEGVCAKYEATIKRFEDELSSQRLSDVEAGIKKATLVLTKNLYRHALDTYQRLLQEAQETTRPYLNELNLQMPKRHQESKAS